MFSVRDAIINELDGWETLQAQSTTATFFQNRDWISLWVKHFDGSSKILSAYENDTLVGIAPFATVDDRIEFLGTSPVLGTELVTDFGDIVAVKGKERQVWEAVIKAYNIKHITDNKFVFKFIREDSLSLPILKELGGKIEEIDVAPYLDLPTTWDEYLQLLDRHDRHELKRKIRKLEEEGAFKVCYEGEASDIDEFFRLMSLSNEQKRSFLSEAMRNYFQDIFTTFLPKKILTLCFLKFGGKNIAATAGFTFGGHFLLYNSGFDPEYGKLAPGFILKAYLIKNAIEKKLAWFEFLRGGERYKYDLGGRERKLYTVKFD